MSRAVGDNQELEKSESTRRPVMGVLDLLTSASLLGAIWMGLPVRWAPVDIVGSALGILLAASGILLLLGHPRSRQVAKASAGIALLIGMGMATTLVITAGSLAGLYGPVGGGGALILLAAAFLLVPYLIVFPAAQLYLLR